MADEAIVSLVVISVHVSRLTIAGSVATNKPKVPAFPSTPPRKPSTYHNPGAYAMKICLVSAGLVAAIGLVGCNTAGQLTPQASAAVTTAYNRICPNVAGLAPVVPQMNAKAQSAYASASALCAAGAPTNAVIAGLDLVTIMNSAVLQPYLARVKIGS